MRTAHLANGPKVLTAPASDLSKERHLHDLHDNQRDSRQQISALFHSIDGRQSRVVNSGPSSISLSCRPCRHAVRLAPATQVSSAANRRGQNRVRPTADAESHVVASQVVMKASFEPSKN